MKYKRMVLAVSLCLASVISLFGAASTHTVKVFINNSFCGDFDKQVLSEHFGSLSSLQGGGVRKVALKAPDTELFKRLYYLAGHFTKDVGAMSSKVRAVLQSCESLSPERLFLAARNLGCEKLLPYIAAVIFMEYKKDVALSNCMGISDIKDAIDQNSACSDYAFKGECAKRKLIEANVHLLLYSRVVSMMLEDMTGKSEIKDLTVQEATSFKDAVLAAVFDNMSTHQVSLLIGALKACHTQTIDLYMKGLSAESKTLLLASADYLDIPIIIASYARDVAGDVTNAAKTDQYKKLPQQLRYVVSRKLLSSLDVSKYTQVYNDTFISGDEMNPDGLIFEKCDAGGGIEVHNLDKKSSYSVHGDSVIEQVSPSEWVTGKDGRFCFVKMSSDKICVKEFEREVPIEELLQSDDEEEHEEQQLNFDEHEGPLVPVDDAFNAFPFEDFEQNDEQLQHDDDLQQDDHEVMQDQFEQEEEEHACTSTDFVYVPQKHLIIQVNALSTGDTFTLYLHDMKSGTEQECVSEDFVEEKDERFVSLSYIDKAYMVLVTNKAVYVDECDTDKPSVSFKRLFGFDNERAVCAQYCDDHNLFIVATDKTVSFYTPGPKGFVAIGQDALKKDFTADICTEAFERSKKTCWDFERCMHITCMGDSYFFVAVGTKACLYKIQVDPSGTKKLIAYDEINISNPDRIVHKPLVGAGLRPEWEFCCCGALQKGNYGDATHHEDNSSCEYVVAADYDEKHNVIIVAVNDDAMHCSRFHIYDIETRQTTATSWDSNLFLDDLMCKKGRLVLNENGRAFVLPSVIAALHQ